MKGDSIPSIPTLNSVPTIIRLKLDDPEFKKLAYVQEKIRRGEITWWERIGVFKTKKIRFYPNKGKTIDIDAKYLGVVNNRGKPFRMNVRKSEDGTELIEEITKY